MSRDRIDDLRLDQALLALEQPETVSGDHEDPEANPEGDRKAGDMVPSRRPWEKT